MNKNTSNQPVKSQPASKPTNAKASTSSQNQPNKRTGGHAADVKPNQRSTNTSKSQQNTPQPNTKMVGGKTHQPSTGKKA
mmetsp:Transcript_1079/g.3687  ORF Transcript_1079/g.3687 Transcript_1079/m.3687 type:complete len:80 (-) Transcript_1079:281-520(-)